MRVGEFIELSPADDFPCRDSITSHDKKRCYLECLEEYVLWLHNLVQKSGQTPTRLERVESYQGLANNSLRVHHCSRQIFPSPRSYFRRACLYTNRKRPRTTTSGRLKRRTRYVVNVEATCCPLELTSEFSSTNFKTACSPCIN